MGIFDATTTDLFTTYRARLRFRDKIAGGTPSNPKLIEGWLRRNIGSTSEEEIRGMTIKTLTELGIDREAFGDDVDMDTRFETLQAVSEHMAKHSNTTMFKRDAEGLYIEQRAVKAMLKECVNVLYAGVEGGWKRAGSSARGKSPKNAAAEWVFVEPDRIHLGVMEPSGIELSIQHTTGPQGPRSSLSYYEYVDRPEITFEVKVLKDWVGPKLWPEIWTYAQVSGLGAKRSQAMGQFDVLAWDKLNGAAE